MKTKLNFQTVNKIKGSMYPYRVILEGYNLRRAFHLSGLRDGYAFSETEIGFEKAWYRVEALKVLRRWSNHMHAATV